MMPPGFLKGDEEEEGALHNFIRFFLAMRKKRKRRTTIQHEPEIYLSLLRHDMVDESEFSPSCSGLFIASRYR
jgi:hypothetical protein